jgi:hypothetical protein
MDMDTMMKVIAYLKALPSQMMTPASTAQPMPTNAAPTYAGNPRGQGAFQNASDLINQRKAQLAQQEAMATGQGQ